MAEVDKVAVMAYLKEQSFKRYWYGNVAKEFPDSNPGARAESEKVFNRLVELGLTPDSEVILSYHRAGPRVWMYGGYERSQWPEWATAFSHPSLGEAMGGLLQKIAD